MPLEDNLNKEVEDIFQETQGRGVDKNVITPGTPAGEQMPADPLYAPPVPPIMPEPIASQERKKGSLLKKLFLSLVLLVLIVFLLAGGYLAYNTYFKDKNGANTIKGVVNLANVNSSSENNQTNQPTNNNQVNKEVASDKDGDGLSDQEEKELGTDPKSSDTDKDNLFDLEEVRVYKTDPTNPDSDHDGYKDGDEVYNGFDPNGPGKLRSLQNEIEKLKK